MRFLDCARDDNRYSAALRMTFCVENDIFCFTTKRWAVF